jgi:alpha-glucuronidase
MFLKILRRKLIIHNLTLQLVDYQILNSLIQLQQLMMNNNNVKKKKKKKKKSKHLQKFRNPTIRVKLCKVFRNKNLGFYNIYFKIKTKIKMKSIKIIKHLQWLKKVWINV